jgi:recombination protein RecA
MPPRQSELDKHLASMRKQYGDRIAVRPTAPALVVSTGSLTVDWALREGGWRMGRMHEILGPPDSAKSCLMIYSAIMHQRAFPAKGVSYIDMEGTFEYDWAESLGLDTSEQRWHHLYPDHSEDASDMARTETMSGLYSAVIVDSVGGMESKKALARDAEDDLVGKNAQVITRMVKHLATLARQKQVTVLLVNQPRAVMKAMASDVSAGPKAMQHATTTKLQMARLGAPEDLHKLKEGDQEETAGWKFRARLMRSKLVPTGRTAEFWVHNRPTEQWGDPGIWRADEYADMGIRLGVIVQAGAWYRFPDGTQVQGRDNVCKMLQAEPARLEQVRVGVLA